MATRRFIVNGGYSSPQRSQLPDAELYEDFNTPEAFEDYVFTRLQRRQPLKLAATIVQDDLARKRSPATRQDFSFRIRALHLEFSFLEVSDDEKHYIRIDIAEEVTFTIFD